MYKLVRNLKANILNVQYVRNAKYYNNRKKFDDAIKLKNKNYNLS